MKYEKVKDHNNLVRDVNSNAIVNKNTNEYNTYIRLRNLKQNESKKIECMEKDINSMKNDIDEIKNLLKQFLNGQ